MNRLSFLLTIVLFQVFTFAVNAQKYDFFTFLDGKTLLKYSTDSVLVNQLVKADAGLMMGMMDYSSERVEAIKNFSSKGVKVSGLLMLKKEDDYWPNVDNVSKLLLRYNALKKFIDTDTLPIQNIGVYSEPDLDFLRKLRGNTWNVIREGMARVFKAEKQEQAAQLCETLINSIKKDGLKEVVFELPYLEDERMAKATSFQRITGVVSFPTENRVPMLLSSYIPKNGVPYIEHYAVGKKGVVLGSLGGGEYVNHTFGVQKTLSWMGVSRDIAIANKYVDKVYLFTLEGALKQGVLSGLTNIDFNQSLVHTDELYQKLESDRKTLTTILSILDYPLVILLAGLVIGALCLYLIIRIFWLIVTKF